MVLNNRPYPDWHEGLTIRGVMEHMKFTWPKLVVKVNGQLIWPEDYDKVTLEKLYCFYAYRCISYYFSRHYYF